MTTNTPIRCECGTVTGTRCECIVGRYDANIIVWIPPSDRESHRAAGNSGTYPHNGAHKLRVCSDCCRDIMEYDAEWTEVLP